MIVRCPTCGKRRNAQPWHDAREITGVCIRCSHSEGKASFRIISFEKRKKLSVVQTKLVLQKPSLSSILKTAKRS